MTAFLDTNVVVRYLAEDPDSASSNRVQALMDSDEEFIFPEVAIAEAGYVLMSVYGIDRMRTVDGLISVIQRHNVRPLMLTSDDAVAALNLCRPSGRVSITDALVWASARATGLPVYTFDRRFPRDGIEVRDP